MPKLQKGGQLYVKKSNIKGARVRIWICFSGYERGLEKFYL